MPRTFNGVGNTYYGKRDVDKDGSYITTEFFVLFYFPLIPIASFRVLPINRQLRWWLIYSSSVTKYIITELPINKQQVVNVYICAFSLVLGIPLLVGCIDYIIGHIKILFI